MSGLSVRNIWLSMAVRMISATCSGGTGAFPGRGERSLSRPSTPSCMNRSCQRHTRVLDFAVAAMMAKVPRPSPLRRQSASARCAYVGSSDQWRWRSSADARRNPVKEMSLRMRQTRMPSCPKESQIGLFRSDHSTRIEAGHSLNVDDHSKKRMIATRPR